MDTKLNLATAQNLSDYWESFQEKLKARHGAAIFNSWFSSLSLLEEESAIVMLSVRSRFIKEWIVVNYYDELKALVKSYKPSLITLNLVVKKDEKEEQLSKEEDSNSLVLSDNSNDNQDVFSTNLDPRLKFSNFVLGEENRVAHAAVKSVLSSNSLTDHINSVYLYSKVGLGKTHLLSSLAHELEREGKTYSMLTSERFSYHYTRAIANRDMISFKEKLYGLDYLLLDDIHFLQGKAGTQAEIINLVSHLVSNNKKLILIGDRKVNDFQDLDARLKSLLSGGIVASLNNPGKVLKEKIIRHKCVENNYHLNDDIVAFLSEQYFSNVREIEGALNKILIHQKILGEEVTTENIADIIQDFILKARKEVLSPDYIIKLIAKHFKLSSCEIKSKKRNKEIVFARDIAVYLSKESTKLSLSEIGKYFARDHATILHAYRKIEKIQKKDLILKFEIEKIREMIHNAD